ncbi:MAG: hypothetical protein NC248_12285 [Bacteroides sp.]|nr:hypothetical protein [Bacteroides sp.]MCM1391106.1 hypothetical protein [Bacteroides sp.]
MATTQYYARRALIPSYISDVEGLNNIFDEYNDIDRCIDEALRLNKIPIS